jgi:hypothetical protein
MAAVPSENQSGLVRKRLLIGESWILFGTLAARRERWDTVDELSFPAMGSGLFSEEKSPPTLFWKRFEDNRHARYPTSDHGIC